MNMDKIEQLTKQVKEMSKGIKKEIKRVKLNPEIRAALNFKNGNIESAFEQALVEVNKSLNVIFEEVSQLKGNLLEVLQKSLAEAITQSDKPESDKSKKDKPAKPTPAPKPKKSEPKLAKNLAAELSAHAKPKTAPKRTVKPLAKPVVKPVAKPVAKKTSLKKPPVSASAIESNKEAPADKNAKE